MTGTHRITSEEELKALYGTPSEAAIVKEVPRLTAEYRALIEAAPFATLATIGPNGPDCSPRGDRPGFVRMVDEATLMLPDRRGNNRMDSLRNVLHDPRAALLFLIPGLGITLRVNGQAHLTTDPALLASFAEEGKEPRSVLVLEITTVFFQCARAVMRARLWDPAAQADPRALPSAGKILAGVTQGRIDSETYDTEWVGRAKDSMW